MNRLFFSLLFFLSISAAKAAEPNKIVFLNSLDKHRYWVRLLYWNLESTFQKSFRNTEFRTETIPKATQSDLWNALNDSENVAVIWLSHSIGRSTQSWNSQRPENAVEMIDARGFEVTPVFSHFHPKLRVLAVVACYSRYLMSLFTRSFLTGESENLENLNLVHFDGLVYPSDGLKQAIQLTLAHLRKPEREPVQTPIDESVVKEGHEIEVRRVFTRMGANVFHPAMRVVMAGKVVGVFPAQKHLKFPFQKMRLSIRGDLDEITIDAGTNSRIGMKKYKQIELGDFSVYEESEQWDAWKLKQIQSGKKKGSLAGIWKRTLIKTD